jgi:hypothetical protein
MELEIKEVFGRGGRDLIRLLKYCVRSVQLDPIFLFLVGEFRRSPTVAKAVALYDIFCSPHGPARISVEEVIPPFNLKIQDLIRPLRINWTRVKASRFAPPETAVTPMLPPRYLFDFISEAVEENSPAVTQVCEEYQYVQLPPDGLPSQQMTPEQKEFVDKVWQPLVRPHLVAAGFWRVASIA